MNVSECGSFWAGLGHCNDVFVEELTRHSVSIHRFRADLERGTVPITVRSLQLCKLARLYNIISIAEPFVPEPSAAEVEVAIRKVKRYKAPGSDQIPGELFQAGGKTLHSEIHKLIMLIWNKEELPHQWKETIVVPIHKKCDKTDCSNYRGISLLSTSYKILSNILLSRLIPYSDEIIGDHQCCFRPNRSTTDQIFYIRQILEKSGSIISQYICYL
jgi:hypothetical protein